jgi:dTDP-4-dehydrorhamnose reductase
MFWKGVTPSTFLLMNIVETAIPGVLIIEPKTLEMLAASSSRPSKQSVTLKRGFRVVFHGGGERPWREDDEPRPLSVYGGSKLAGERAVRGAAGPHLLVRTSWVYAATGKNFLRTITRLAGERPELRVVSDQVGASTPARVVADGIHSVLRGDASELRRRFSAAGGLVHLAAAGHTSWHGFAIRIVEGLKARRAPVKAERIIPIRTEEYPTKAVRPRNSRLDLARLKDLFGIEPPQWEAALAVELDLLVEQPHVD